MNTTRKKRASSVDLKPKIIVLAHLPSRCELPCDHHRRARNRNSTKQKARSNCCHRTKRTENDSVGVDVRTCTELAVFEALGRHVLPRALNERRQQERKVGTIVRSNSFCGMFEYAPSLFTHPRTTFTTRYDAVRRTCVPWPFSAFLRTRERPKSEIFARPCAYGNALSQREREGE